MINQFPIRSYFLAISLSLSLSLSFSLSLFLSLSLLVSFTHQRFFLRVIPIAHIHNKQNLARHQRDTSIVILLFQRQHIDVKIQNLLHFAARISQWFCTRLRTSVTCVTGDGISHSITSTLFRDLIDTAISYLNF